MNGQLSLVTEKSYSEQARAWIEGLAPGEEFTAEAVRHAIGEPDEANALGAIFMRASKRGLITYRGRDFRSPRHAARGRWVRVWTRTEVPA
jgi:hypothetical protein